MLFLVDSTGVPSVAAMTQVTAADATDPDLILTKSHAGSFTQGQIGAIYTLTVTNSGATPTSGSVSVSDTVPAGLTATGIAGTGWALHATGGPVHAQRCVSGRGELPGTDTDCECSEQCRGERHQHGDGERRWGDEREQ